MAHYLDPKNDLTFKRVFGEHPHLCISLLNSILPFDEEHRIASIEYLPSELMVYIPEKRNSIMDVRCKDLTGRQFIVEIQMLWTELFTSRVLFNVSKAYISHPDKGWDYKYRQPVYALNFVNQIFYPEYQDYYHHYRMVNTKETGKRIEGLEFVFIELPKFKARNRGEKKLHELWLRFLTEIEDNTRRAPDELIEDVDTNEALRYLEEGTYSEAELYAYEKCWDIIMVEKALCSDSYAKGLAEGLAEGRAEGREKGREKGLAEGKIERKNLKTALGEEKKVVGEKDRALEEEKKVIEEQEKAIGELKRQLAEMQRNNS